MATEWIEGRDPGDERDETPEPRFFVDARIGCVAVIDRDLRDPEYPGLHPDTPGVVRFWPGARDAGGAWMVPEEAAREARALCERLNSEPETPEVAGGEREAIARELLRTFDTVATWDTLGDVSRTYWLEKADRILALLSARPAPERESEPMDVEVIGAAIHAALRKIDSTGCSKAWRAIRDLDAVTWREVLQQIAHDLSFHFSRPEPVSEPEPPAIKETVLAGRVEMVKVAPEPWSEPEPAPGAEPVAWRVRPKGRPWLDGHEGWRVVLSDDDPLALNPEYAHEYEAVPLFASPPSESAGERELREAWARYLHACRDVVEIILSAPKRAPEDPDFHWGDLDADGMVNAMGTVDSAWEAYVDAREDFDGSDDELETIEAALASSPAPSGGET